MSGRSFASIVAMLHVVIWFAAVSFEVALLTLLYLFDLLLDGCADLEVELLQVYYLLDGQSRILLELLLASLVLVLEDLEDLVYGWVVERVTVEIFKLLQLTLYFGYYFVQRWRYFLVHLLLYFLHSVFELKRGVVLLESEQQRFSVISFELPANILKSYPLFLWLGVCLAQLLNFFLDKLMLFGKFMNDLVFVIALDVHDNRSEVGLYFIHSLVATHLNICGTWLISGHKLFLYEIVHGCDLIMNIFQLFLDAIFQ